MKQLLFILSILAALLCSCTQREPAMPEAPLYSELAALDTLMQTEPDSALYALLDFSSTHKELAPFDRRYADLLLSEALFKCDCEQTARPALLDALNYFDSLAAAHPVSDDYTLLSARSHYMNGVGLMEADSTVEACDEYLKTLEIMENRFDEKELVGQKAKFMALTYNRLGDLFSDHLMTEQALLCYKQSFHFCKIEPISKYASSNLLVHIGIHFNMLKQPDSALCFYNMAEAFVPDSSNIVYRDILTSRAILLYDLEGNAEDVLNVLSRVREEATTEEEKVSRDLIRSEVFLREGMIDSTQACLERVFNSDTDFLSKIQAARYLSEIYTKKKEPEKALYFKSFLAPLAVESYEQKNKDSQMVELFENHQKQVLHNQYKARNNSLTQGILWTTIILVFVVIPIIIYAKRRRHLKKITESEDKMKQEKQQHTALVNRMQNANARLREENQRLTKDSMQSVLFTPKENPTVCDYETLINEPICVELLNRFLNTDIITTNPSSFYSNLAITQEEKRKYAETIERCCPVFTNKLTLLYPNMGKAELTVCQYLLIGLTFPQIAVLTQKDFSTLWRNERNIKAKMGCTNIHVYLKRLFFNDSK